jgi:surfactin synthase thioesterase subunit
MLFALPRYREGTAAKLRMPVLMCVGDQDLQASP